jgi:hypothetical protein
MTIAFVYKWTEISTGKWYIGSRTAEGCHPNDGYICSSKTVEPMIVDSPNDWNREIIAMGDPKEMRILENTTLLELDAKNHPMSYNKHNGDGLFNASGHNKGRKTVHKGNQYKRIHPEEIKKYIAEGWVLGTPKAVKDKISATNKGGKFGGHKNCGPKKGSIPWNKGKTENRQEVLMRMSLSHVGKTYNKNIVRVKE